LERPWREGTRVGCHKVEQGKHETETQPEYLVETQMHLYFGLPTNCSKEVVLENERGSPVREFGCGMGAHSKRSR